MSKPRFISTECTNCGASFDRIPVDYDEDGNGEYSLDSSRCAHLTCGKLLCTECSQFSCDGCGHTFCSSHRVLVPNGIYPALECCAVCASECEEEQPVTPIPPQRETGAQANREVA